MHLFHQVKMSLLDKKDADPGKCCGGTVPKVLPRMDRIREKCSAFKAVLPVFQLWNNVMVTSFEISHLRRSGMTLNFSTVFSKGYSPNPLENPLVDEKDAVFRAALIRPVRRKIRKISSCHHRHEDICIRLRSSQMFGGGVSLAYLLLCCRLNGRSTRLRL